MKSGVLVKKWILLRDEHFDTFWTALVKVRSPIQCAGLAITSAQDQNEKATASVASHSKPAHRNGQQTLLATFSKKKGVKVMYPPIVMIFKCDYVPPKCDKVPLGQALCSVKRISQLCSETWSHLMRRGRYFTFVIAVRIRICEALWVNDCAFPSSPWCKKKRPDTN